MGKAAEGTRDIRAFIGGGGKGEEEARSSLEIFFRVKKERNISRGIRQGCVLWVRAFFFLILLLH